MRPSIKFRYKEASAKLVFVEPGHYSLMSVWSSIRHSGQAGGIMQAIVEYADTHYLTLTLVAQQYGHPIQTGLTSSELEDFYAVFGFQKNGKSKPESMIRYPS